MYNSVQRNPFTTALICVILLLLLWVPVLIRPITPVTFDSGTLMPLQQWVINDLGLQGYTGIWTSFILIVLSSLLLFFINGRHVLVSRQETLMLALFISLSSTMPESQQFSGSQAAVLFILLSIYYLFNSIQVINALSSLYLSSFWASMASLFYLPSIVFLPALMFGIVVSRPFIWRDWVAYITGISTPYFYIFFYSFLTGHNISLVDIVTRNIFVWSLPEFTSYTPEFLFFVLLFIISLISMLFFRPAGALFKIKITRMRQILKWTTFFFIIAIILFHPLYYSMMPLLSFPLSVLITSYYNQIHRKKILNFLIFLLCLAIINIKITLPL